MTIKTSVLIYSSLLFVMSPVYAGQHAQAEANTKSEHCEQHAEHHGNAHGKHQNRQGDNAGMFGAELKLSGTQKQEFASLMQIYGPRLQEIRKRGQDERKRLLSMAPDDPDYSKLTDLVAKDASKSATEVVVLLAELQSNAYALLTPEQQQKSGEFRQKILERLDTIRERGGKGMRRGAGKNRMRHQGKHKGRSGHPK
jgi:Spy/CpxP family protein refolding chaperone